MTIGNVLTEYNSQCLGGFAFAPRGAAVLARSGAGQSSYVVRCHLADANSCVTQIAGRHVTRRHSLVVEVFVVFIVVIVV